MSGHRPVARLLRLAAAVAALASYALWVRPQMLTWGATPDETTRTYLGDELVSDPDGGATIAKFLPAPPERSSPERPGGALPPPRGYRGAFPAMRGVPGGTDYPLPPKALATRSVTVRSAASIARNAADRPAQQLRVAFGRLLREPGVSLCIVVPLLAQGISAGG